MEQDLDFKEEKEQYRARPLIAPHYHEKQYLSFKCRQVPIILLE